MTEVSFYESLRQMLEYFATILCGAEPIKKIRKISYFSGCPPPQWGALGDGYDVPGGRARRLVFNTTVKIRNSCLLSNLIPGQMDTKSVLISAAKQVIVLGGRKTWPTTCATSKPGVITRTEIKTGFMAFPA